MIQNYSENENCLIIVTLREHKEISIQVLDDNS